MRHTVVISDLHLSQLEPGSGPWMRHRQAHAAPDADLAALFDHLASLTYLGSSLCLVLAGDVFDFDAPIVTGQTSRLQGTDRTEARAVATLDAILDDHPRFVEALEALLVIGVEIVFISGNHDAELTLPAVRARLRDRLRHAGSRSSASSGTLSFRAWFHRTPDGILIEHGHQYDPACSHRHPMHPFTLDGHEIEPTLGSLGSRLLAARVGTLDPHDDRVLPLRPLPFAAHWARHYLASRRLLLLGFATGIGRSLSLLHRHSPRDDARERRSSRALRRRDLRAASFETGASLSAVTRHARLAARPTGDRLLSVARALFVDHVLFGALALLGAAALVLLAPRPWVLTASLPLAAFLVYASAARASPLAAGWRSAGHSAEAIARIHDARAVVFGHTHAPEGRWGEGGVFVGNSGSWPASADGRPRPRPVVWLRSEGAHLEGGLYAFTSGSLVPQSFGTNRERSTPGSEATNANPKNAVNPSCVARNPLA